MWKCPTVPFCLERWVNPIISTLQWLMGIPCFTVHLCCIVLYTYFYTCSETRRLISLFPEETKNDASWLLWQYFGNFLFSFVLDNYPRRNKRRCDLTVLSILWDIPFLIMFRYAGMLILHTFFILYETFKSKHQVST